MTQLGNLVDNQTLCKFLKWYLSNPLKKKATYSSDKYSFKDCAYAKQFLDEAKHADKPIAFRGKLLSVCGLKGLSGKNLADSHINQEGGYPLGLHSSSSHLNSDDLDDNPWSVKRYMKYLKKQTIVPFSVVSHNAKVHNEHAKELAAEYDAKIRYYYAIVKKEYHNTLIKLEKHLHHFYKFKKIMHFGNKDLDAIAKTKKIQKVIKNNVHNFLNAKITKEDFGYDINLDDMRETFEQGCTDEGDNPVLDIWRTHTVNHHIWSHPDYDKGVYTTKDVVPVNNPLSKLAFYALKKFRLNIIYINLVKPVPCFKSDANLDNVLNTCNNHPHCQITDPKIMADYKTYVQHK